MPYMWIVFGVMLFVGGNYLLISWKELKKKPEEKPGSWKIVISLLLMTCGQLATTYGWNIRSADGLTQKLRTTNNVFTAALTSSLGETNQKFRDDLDVRDANFKAAQEERDLQLQRAKKRATILAVAREWKLNEMMRARWPFSDYEKGDRDKLLTDLPFLPKFENFQSKAACTSEVLDWTAHNDQALIVCMMTYAEIIESVNQVFDAVNAGGSAQLQTKEYTSSLSKGIFGEHGAYPTFLIHHNTFCELLKRDHKSVFDDIGAISRPTQEPKKDGK